MMIGDKSDKLYLDIQIDLLKQIIETTRSKTSVKITSMKDLADDDVLKDVFSQLIDGRYSEYEKALAKVYGKMDKVDSDIEKCFNDYAHLIELRKDIKRNEQKLDRIYSLMELNAFGKEDTDSDDEIIKIEVTSKQDKEESKFDDNIINPKPTRSVHNENISRSENGDQNLNITQPIITKSTKVVSTDSMKKISGFKVDNKNKEKQASIKKINALKVMFVELESKVDVINKRLSDIEYSDQLISSAGEEAAQNSGSVVHSKGTLMIQAEFMGVKHLVGRQQISIRKIENVIKQINEWKDEFNANKIFDDHKTDLEILKKYIEEVNDYHMKMYKNTEHQLHNKADFSILDEFTQNVENKVMKDLKTKIDKIDHKRMQNSMKKKLEAIEREVVEMSKASLNGSAPFISSFFMVKDK